MIIVDFILYYFFFQLTLKTKIITKIAQVFVQLIYPRWGNLYPGANNPTYQARLRFLK